MAFVLKRNYLQLFFRPFCSCGYLPFGLTLRGQSVYTLRVPHPDLTERHPMRRDDCYYDLFPRVVPAERRVTLTLRPRFAHWRWPAEAEYELTLYSLNDSAASGPTRVKLRLVEGALRFEHAFGGEGEYTLMVEAILNEQRRPVGEFHLYALEQDLFSLRPYKGDLHLHTYYSDGWESPVYVAARCREIGMDFIAITDHHRYAPSLEAIRTFADVPIDLRLYPGEEVHPPECPVHIVNFGGSFSLNERFSEAGYRAEVETLARHLPAPPAGVDALQYAACVWCFQHIRQGGGLGVFCHPYWVAGRRFDVPEALTSHLLETQPFDALELIGGYTLAEAEANVLQVARYAEERACGREIPIVGASDSHGCERGEFFGWYYTIVLSPSPELPDLIASIKGLRSVAVEALPGQMPRAYGPFRLVRYAQFLLREILPLHDELVAQEGRWMRAYLVGEASAVSAPGQGRAAALYDHLWAGA